MPTLPTLTVLLDDGTGTFPINITTKVMGFDGYEISRGRADWIGAVTAGELTLTLNNSDGRFTPGSTILGSPSPIKVDQRIRLKETVNGVTYTRCTAYVKSWPVAWPEVVTTFSTVQITATDAQARAERRPLKSMLEEEILSDSPTAYYTLGEAAGSTSAGDTSGNQSSPLTVVGTVGFGNGIGPVDGLSAVTFTGAGYLSGDASLIDGTSGNIAFAIATTATSVDILGWLFVSGGVTFSVLLRVNSTGHLEWVGSGSIFGATAVAINDGLTHFVEWNMASSPADTPRGLWVDGSQQITTTSGLAGVTFSDLRFGAAVGADAGTKFTGTLSHISLSSAEVFATRIAVRYAAVAGFLGDTADARVSRLAGYAELPTGTLDASVTTMPAQATSGGSAQDAIQEVVDAELGLVFIDGSGNLTFHNRSRVTSKTTPDLTLSSQFVTPDVQPVTDDQQIVNYVESTAAGTGGVSVVLDAASETSHGRYPVSEAYLVLTDSEALARGQWIVAKQAEPTARYGTLTINLYKMSAAQASATLAALDLDCRLQVTSMASQTPGGTTVDVVVQGWRAVTTAESWAITCNVVPFDLFEAAIWDDPGSLWDTAVWAI